MARRRRALGLTVVAAALIALVVFGLAHHRSAAVGGQAPALARETLAGPAVTLPGLLADARGGPALVVFWASWCGPCAREAPALERIADSDAGRNRLVGVDWSDAASGARSFIRHYGWTFPNLRDAEGTVGDDYPLTSLPTTFVLDGRGRIEAQLHGPQDEASF